MLKRMYIIYATLFLVSSGFSQTSVSVVSATDSTVIPEAMVVLNRISGNNKPCFTDQLGVAVIPPELLPESGTFSFHIVADGYSVCCDSMSVRTSKTCYLKPDIGEMEEVVITAQMLPSTAEKSIQKVTVISRETIDAKGATNLRDALQNELNIRLSQDQILGAALTLKGMGGEGVKIMIDGVPLTGRNDGNLDLSQINLATIERIEIIEGPLSVNYGSNAIAGTINLISKKNTHPGHTLSGNTLYESSGHYNAHLSYHLTKGKHHFTLSGGRNYFDGWTNNDPQFEFPKEKPADSSRFKSWKPKEQFVYGLRYQFNTKRWALTPFADLFTEKMTNRGLPKAPYQITAFDDYYATQRLNSGLNLNGSFGKLKLKGLFDYNSYNRIKNTYITDLTTLQRQLTLNAGDQDTTTFQLLFSRITLSRASQDATINVETGLEYNRETGTGTRIENQRKTLLDVALFGTMEYRPVKSLVVNPGLRFNYNSVYGPVVVPSVNLKFNRRGHILRANYARGFRTPSIKELFLEFVDINHNILGNPDLKPETSNHYQLWYTLSDTVKKAVFSYEINPFFQQIQHKISLAQSGDGTLYSYFNIDTYQCMGVQLSVACKRRSVQLKTGFSYLGIATNYTANQFYYTPEITATLTYELNKIPLSFSGFYKYTGKVSAFYLQEDQTIEPIFIADYHMLDVQANYSFWKKHMQLAVGARNLFDIRNINSSGNAGIHSGGTSTPIGVGRTYYLSLTFNFTYYK